MQLFDSISSFELSKFLLFRLQLAPLETELFLRCFLGEAIVGHLAGGAYGAVVAQRGFDEGEVALRFLDVPADFEGDAVARGHGVAIAHGELDGLTGGL